MTRGWFFWTYIWSLERDSQFPYLNLQLKFGTWLAVDVTQLIIEVWNMNRSWRNSIYDWSLERDSQLRHLTLVTPAIK